LIAVLFYSSYLGFNRSLQKTFPEILITGKDEKLEWTGFDTCIGFASFGSIDGSRFIK